MDSYSYGSRAMHVHPAVLGVTMASWNTATRTAAPVLQWGGTPQARVDSEKYLEIHMHARDVHGRVPRGTT